MEAKNNGALHTMGGLPNKTNEVKITHYPQTQFNHYQKLKF